MVVYFGNIISTDTDTNQCAVLFIYTGDTSSRVFLVNRGTSSSFSANLETNVLKSIRIYPSDNYVHSSGDTVTVTNFMVCPKFLYDADTTYQPYALPSTKITPELIELVDSGAKNKMQLTDSAGTSRVIDGITYTVNSDGSITANGTAASLSRYEFATYSANSNEILSGATGGSPSTYFIYIRGGSSDYVYNGGVEILTADVGVSRSYAIVVSSGQTVNNVVFKPMVCSKAAWDVSQKYVPYRPSYEETVEQVAENENNISTFCICDYSETAFTATTTNSYEYTGISFTVPAQQVYEFHVADRYTGSGNNFGTGLIIADSATNIDVNATIIAENIDTNSQSGKSYWMRQVSGITPIRNSNTTYYIWVNRGSTVSSYIIKCLRRVY